jgi:hypothetical protein
VSDRARWWYQVFGWGLFVVSAFLYMVSAWLAGDWTAVGASLAFLIACIFFLIPLARSIPPIRPPGP